MYVPVPKQHCVQTIVERNSAADIDGNVVAATQLTAPCPFSPMHSRTLMEEQELVFSG